MESPIFIEVAMKYRFTPSTLKELLSLLYDAALNHPDNNSSIDFPAAELLYDGTFSIVHDGKLFEADHTELSLSE